MRQLLKISICAAILTSCGSVQSISYFQNAEPEVGVEGAAVQEIRFKAEDQLSIVVNTKDPLLDELFNLSIAARVVGSEGSTSQNMLSTYTVSPEGYIDFPVLGLIPIAGKSRHEVSRDIQELLKAEKLVSDPIVTVEYCGLYLSVLGEVAAPGRYNIEEDNITLIDAISLAGDLTIYGRRDGVMVVREEGDEYIPYRVNMLDMADLYGSPVYYLQQGDLVYVEPNDVRIRQSTLNGNNVRSTSFWISLSSLIITISLLFI